MKRIFLGALLLGLGCSANYYKLEGDTKYLYSPRVDRFLREEGGWMEVEVSGKKGTLRGPVMEADTDSVLVFLGITKEGLPDSAWFKMDKVAKAEYIVPLNAQRLAWSYAGRAALVTAGIGLGLAAGAFLYEYWANKGDLDAFHEPPYYLVALGAAGAVLPVASGWAYIRGFREGKKRDEFIKKKLRIFLGMEEW